MLPAMGGEATSPTALPVEGESTTLLRFDPRAPEASAPDTVVVVLDTTWIPPSAGRIAGRCISLRDIAERVMSGRDLFAESAELLDAWAEESGVVDALVVEGVSFWHGERLRCTRWLADQAVWLGIVEALVATERPTAIECSPEPMRISSSPRAR